VKTVITFSYTHTLSTGYALLSIAAAIQKHFAFSGSGCVPT